MKRVAIIAAIPGELKPLVKGWEQQRRNGVDLWSIRQAGMEWVAGCGGAGQSAATRVFAEMEKDGRIDEVISTGWAGALSESCEPGKVYDVSSVVDARTGERFQVSVPLPACGLVTNSRVAIGAEKQRLANTYGAVLVDMEAVAVARLAAMRGIPFFCIKGVSDGAHARLPDLNRFLTPSGQFRMGSFVVFALFRPRYWSALIEMGENSKKAAAGIADTVRELLQERGHNKDRNGHSNLQG